MRDALINFRNKLRQKYNSNIKKIDATSIPFIVNILKNASVKLLADGKTSVKFNGPKETDLSMFKTSFLANGMSVNKKIRRLMSPSYDDRVE